MKKGILFLILIISTTCYGQNPAQEALDFYANNILPIKRGIVVRYDGQVEKVDSSYNELAHIVLDEFYRCKVDPRGDSNNKIKIDSKNWLELSKAIRNEVFKPQHKVEGKLTIPANIRSKKKLKYKDLKGGFVRFYAEKIYHLVFPVKFNLTVEPLVSYNGNDYVWLRVSKNDLEYGSWYFIKLSQQKVLDWCEVSWIQ
ncbi:hypothetical protein JYB64_20015 [Algoriphagus aestuarii]|nr:hypothetical protein [Algoriphagus aestuarii]